MSFRRYLFIVCIAFSLSLSFYRPSWADIDVDGLFRERKWSEMDLYVSKDLPPREKSLIANSLWLRGKWGESLSVMESIGDSYPDDVKPYANMLMVLAHERLGDVNKAYSMALELYKSGPPEVLDYYVSYALSRLTSNEDEKRKWLRRMVSMTDDKDLRRQALNDLLSMDSPSMEDARAILKISPRESVALSLFKKSSPSLERSYRLGYAAYLDGEYNRASSYLSQVPVDRYYGQSSAYYLGMSYYRLKDYKKSLDVFSKLLMLDGSDYVRRSARRISILANKSLREDCIDVLKAASEKIDGTDGLYVWSTYIDLQRGSSKLKAQDELISKYPSSDLASNILWERGWSSFRGEDYSSAVSNFKKALKGADGLDRAKLYYWISKVLDKQGKPKESDVYELKLHSQPLSIYSFLAFPNGAIPIKDVLSGFEERDSLLVQWGFISHASMVLMTSDDPSDRLNAARLSKWMGHEEESFRAARALDKYLLNKNSLSRELMEYLYPRPYRQEVNVYAAKFKVEPGLVWAIMRQESAFNPKAGSWVGASGLMQLMPATAAEEAKSVGLKNHKIFSVDHNILMGTSHIARLLTYYKRSEWAVAAYNAGRGNVNKWNKIHGDDPFDIWMEEIPFDETRNYVKRVMANLFTYRRLYGD